MSQISAAAGTQARGTGADGVDIHFPGLGLSHQLESMIYHQFPERLISSDRAIKHSCSFDLGPSFSCEAQGNGENAGSM